MVLQLVEVSERIAVLTQATRGSLVIIIQDPAEASSEEELEDFYTKLEATLDSLKPPVNLIIGYFNS